MARKTRKKPINIKRWAISILVAAVIIIGPLFIPVGPLEGLDQAKTFADNDSRFININGIDIHYREMGSGDKTYLLFHGIDESIHTWDNVMPILAQTGRVIAFDRPGFGLSDRPTEWSDVNPYAPESQIDIIYQFMNQLFINQAVMIGHGEGGMTALDFTLMYYERVYSLVFVDSSIINPSSPPIWIRLLMNTPQFEHNGRLIARFIGGKTNDTLRSKWHNPSNIQPELYDSYNQYMKIENWDEAMWNVYKNNYSIGSEKKLDKLKMPVLVINGDYDKQVSVDDSKALASSIKGAVFATIEDSGHNPHEERPDKFVEEIQSFLSQIQPVF